MPEPPIYPILKEYDWNAKDLSAHEHFAGKDKPPVPLIAFGRNAENHYVFVTKADLEQRTLAEIKKEAYANIESYPCTWELVTPNLLTASGTDFSAEKILSKAFLVEAQEVLNAEVIYIGVPRRRCILAMNANATEDAMTEFYKMFLYTFLDDSFGNAPITNLLFRYKDGELIGAQLVEEAGDLKVGTSR